MLTHYLRNRERRFKRLMLRKTSSLHMRTPRSFSSPFTTCSTSHPMNSKCISRISQVTARIRMGLTKIMSEIPYIRRRAIRLRLRTLGVMGKERAVIKNTTPLRTELINSYLIQTYWGLRGQRVSRMVVSSISKPTTTISNSRVDKLNHFYGRRITRKV